ncbi:MAG TPA: tetratricopeptide repeat protein [Streptosporangiaceae bacterium]
MDDLDLPAVDQPVSPGPQGTAQYAVADHAGRVAQAGRDLYDIDVQLSDLALVARKAALAKPLVVPHRRIPADRLRGRAELLSALLADVEAVSAGAGASQRVWVLHGMGGCGKTTVALEVAHRAQSLGIRSWWVAVALTAELEASLHAVAFDAGVDANDLGRRHPADVLWDGLNRLDQPWLLVIDNADDLDLLTAGTGRLSDGRGWLRFPATTSGLVLVTTREGAKPAWGPWAHLVQVPVLAAEDGAQVLLDLAPAAGDPDQARALSAWLGGLPLALDLAGSFLADTEVELWPRADAPATFAAYQAALTSNLDSLGADSHAAGSDDSRRRLTTTWEMSLDLLAGRGSPRSRPLLRLLACLGPAPVPYTTLLAADVLSESPLFADATAPELARALEGLVRLGLVNIARAKSADEFRQRTALLPPLVRATNRAHKDLVERAAEYEGLLIVLLERAIAGAAPEDPQTWRRWSALEAHCMSLLSLPWPRPSTDSPESVFRLSEPGHLAARYLHAAGFYAQAAAAHRQVVRIRAEALGERDPRTLTARHHLALTLRDDGRWDEAAAEYTAVLALRHELLGDLHPDTLTSRHGLASVLRRQGHLDRAESQFREVYRLRAAVLGAEHPDTLATRLKLAFVLKARDQAAAAEAAYRSVLEIQSARLGELNVDTLETRQSLAGVLQAQGRIDLAEAEFHAVYQQRRLKLGDGHPDTLTSRHSLAYVLRLRGKYTEAESEYREIIVLQQATVGATHPAILGTRHNLAVVIQDQERLDDAQSEFAEVLAIRRRVLGDSNPDTLDTRHALAYIQRLRGRYSEAESEYRQIIALQQAIVGPEHPTALGTSHNLGMVLQDAGRLYEAATVYAAVLDARERTLGHDHHDTSATRTSLAEVRRRLAAG